MLYRVNAMAIRPLWEWTTTFERLWRHQLSKVKENDPSRGKEQADLIWRRVLAPAFEANE